VRRLVHDCRRRIVATLRARSYRELILPLSGRLSLLSLKLLLFLLLLALVVFMSRNAATDGAKHTMVRKVTGCRTSNTGTARMLSESVSTWDAQLAISSCMNTRSM
jgi:hypothetical protein